MLNFSIKGKRYTWVSRDHPAFQGFIAYREHRIYADSDLASIVHELIHAFGYEYNKSWYVDEKLVEEWAQILSEFVEKNVDSLQMLLLSLVK